MLSDAIHAMRTRVVAADGGARSDLDLMLRAFEVEARDMENRIQYLTGQPHASRLISAPVIEIGNQHVS